MPLTLQVNINKQKKDAFQILKPELEVDPESNPHFDQSMGINKNKLLRPKRMSFQFVEEGKWSKEAEMMKLKVLLIMPLHFHHHFICCLPVFVVFLHAICRVNLEKKGQKI